MGTLPSGAYFDLSGEVALNATWQENIYFMQSGAPLDLTGLSFKMSFWQCPNQAYGAWWLANVPQLTLSTANGTLSIVADPDSGIDNILYINVPAGSLACERGDYRCDLASEDVNGIVTPWASGIVSFSPNSISF